MDPENIVSEEYTVGVVVPAKRLGGCLLGGALGWGVGFAFVVLGVVLSCTGVGAIIGIPLALGGLLCPVLAGALGASSAAHRLRGPCPYCGQVLIGEGIGFACPSCARRIVVRGNHLHRIRQDDPAK